MGTGFLLDDGHVVTAAHVANGAQAISAQTEEGETADALVVDVFPDHDLAVLELTEPLGGEPFQLASRVPERGSPIAIVGYPLGSYTLQISQGIVKGLDERIAGEDGTIERAHVTDAAGNGGNSGGPVLDEDGSVVGVFTAVGLAASDSVPSATVRAEGTGFFIPVDDLSSDLAALEADDSPDTACSSDDVIPPEDNPPDEGDALEISDEADPLEAIVGQVLFTHGTLINEGSFPAAFESFTPREQQELGGLDAWTQGVAGSTWRSIDVQSASDEESGVSAKVLLKTEDIMDDEVICRAFALTYTFTWEEEGLLIDRASGRATGC